MLKVADLFCGTGGFSKGFEDCQTANFRTVLGVDLLPTSVETFKANHKHAIGIASDIRKISNADIVEATNLKKEELDVVIGGPPCQGFSSIRPFRSSNDDDPRNNLFEEFASFVNYFRPKKFVLENVVGLATHKGGTTIEQIQDCFSNLGYTTDWRILNAAHYGVPQKRERLILIGSYGSSRINFPSPTHYFEGKTIGHKVRSRHICVSSGGHDLFSQALPLAVTAFEAISDLPSIESGEFAENYTVKPTNNYQAERRGSHTKLTHHESTRHSAKMLEIIKHSGENIHCIPKHLITSGFSSSYSRIAKDEPAVTITVNFVHPASNRCIHPTQNRALTIREGARIQSFDDKFEFFGSRTQIAKQIGNAVPPLLGKAIANAICKDL